MTKKYVPLKSQHTLLTCMQMYVFMQLTIM